MRADITRRSASKHERGGDGRALTKCSNGVTISRESLGRRTAMIIGNQRELTDAVLGELDRATNPRFREIMAAAVRHLHDFAREVRLTETEFQQACAYIAAL